MDEKEETREARVSFAIEHPLANLPTFYPPEGAKHTDDAVLDTIGQTLRNL